MNSQILGAALFGFGLCAFFWATSLRDSIAAIATGFVMAGGLLLVLYDPVPKQFGVIDHEAAHEIRLAQARARANAGY